MKCRDFPKYGASPHSLPLSFAKGQRRGGRGVRFPYPFCNCCGVRSPVGGTMKPETLFCWPQKLSVWKR
jgi:hypothetical protein